MLKSVMPIAFVELLSAMRNTYINRDTRQALQPLACV